MGVPLSFRVQSATFETESTLTAGSLDFRRLSSLRTALGQKLLFRPLGQVAMPLWRTRYPDEPLTHFRRVGVSRLF